MCAETADLFSELTERKRKNMGPRLQKIDDPNGHDHERALEKAVSWDKTGALLWHWPGSSEPTRSGTRR